MKKLIAGSLAMTMLMAPAMAQEVSVYLNNEKMIFDQNPIIENGRTLVPLRSIFEGLGAEVKWNPDIQEIKGLTEDREIVLRVGEITATVNGEPVTLDVPAKIENGRTLVPLRFISESLDKEVKWNADEYRIDIVNEEVIANISTEYDAIRDESEGMIAVQKGEKQGFININGELVVPCIYDAVGDFYDGLAWVGINQKPDSWDLKFGFIDKTGKEIIPCIYDHPGDFSEGFVRVGKDFKYGFIDKEGKEITPFVYNIAFGFDNGLAYVGKTIDDKHMEGYIDRTGKEIVPCIYSDSDVTAYEGIVEIRENGQTKYIYPKKGISIDNYDGMRSFNEGLAVVSKGMKTGYIDETGKEVVPCIYDIGRNFSGGYAGVYVDGKWGFIDKAGNLIIPCIYDELSGFSDGLARVKLDDNWGYIDETGKVVIPCIYKSAEDFGQGLALVHDGSNAYFINRKGEKVISLEKYTDIDRFYNEIGGVTMVGVGDYESGFKYGLIDTTGKEVLPCIYDEIGGNMYELRDYSAIKIEKDGKFGYVDTTGKIIIPCVYNEAEIHGYV